MAGLGFIPAGHLNGGLVRASPHRIAYNYGTAIGQYDAVLLSSGNVIVAVENSSTILGSFAGCSYTNNNGEIIFSPNWPGVALTDTAAVVTAWVYDDPGILFEVKASGTYSQANVGVAYDLNSGTPTTWGRSTMELDLSDTGTGQFVVYRRSDKADNPATASPFVLVFNNVPVMA